MAGKVPKYQEVADTIAREIQEGEFPLGSLLPTESEFADRFDVSRHTIRHGLRELRARGLIVSRQGRGSEVTACRASELGGDALHTMSEFISSPFNGAVTVTSVERITADEDDAEAFGVNVGATLCHVQARVSAMQFEDRERTEVPVGLLIAPAHAQFFEGRSRISDNLPQRFAETEKLQLARIDQVVRFIEAPGGESGMTGRLAIERRYIAADDRPVLVMRAECPPGVFVLQSRCDIAAH